MEGIDIENITKMIEPKTETEKIVYLVDLLKKLPEDKANNVSKILDEIVQSKYERLMNRGLIYGIESLQKLTGIKPILDQKLIESAYEELIKNKISNFSQKMQILYRVTKIRPNFGEETVQSVYSWAINKGRAYDFEIVWEVTGIKPTEELISEFEKLCDEHERKLAQLKENSQDSD